MVEPLEEFEAHRGLLFSLAYRMLANVADAEDVVQEAFVRWQSLPDHSTVRSPKAFLSSVVTRLSIDHIRASTVRAREDIVAALPEPVSASYVGESETLADSLSIAFLMLVQKLTPIERAAFLLREVFGYEYEEVATTIGKSAVNCRQIVRRAKQRLSTGRTRHRSSKAAARRLVEGFEAAIENGNVEGLVQLLSPDVTLYADGGTDRQTYGRARAIARPVSGADHVAQFLISVQSQAPAGIQTRIESVNGEPAILAYVKETLVAILSFEFEGGLIQSVFIQQDGNKQNGMGPLRHYPWDHR